VIGEPGGGAAQEPGTGRVTLVGQGLDVGQSGVVVHGDVEEVVAQRSAVDLAAADFFAATVQAPATAVGDSAELLDIDVDQIAGPRMLVASCGLLSADRSSGDRVERTKRHHLARAADRYPAPCINPALAYSERSGDWMNRGTSERFYGRD